MAIRHIIGSVYKKKDSRTQKWLLNQLQAFISWMLGWPIEFKSVAAVSFPETESDKLDILASLNQILRVRGDDLPKHLMLTVWTNQVIPMTGMIFESVRREYIIPAETINRFKAINDKVELKRRSDGGGIDYRESPAASRLWEIIQQERGDNSTVVVWGMGSDRLIIGRYGYLDGKVEPYHQRLEIQISKV